MPLTKQQSQLLRALEQEFYVISKACQKVGIDRKTYYNWLEKNPEFKRACEKADEDLMVLVEDRLKHATLKNAPWAVRFFLSRRHPLYKYKVEVEEKPTFLFEADEDS